MRAIFCLSLVGISLSLLHIGRQMDAQKAWHTLWHVFAIAVALSVLEIQRVA